MLVALIFATSALVLVRAFTSTNVYNATITFSSADEQTLSSLDANKANVVSAALESNNKPIDLSVKIADNLSVTAVVPAGNKDDTSFIPNSFIVSLKTIPGFNFSSEEYKALVGCIATEYVNQFAYGTLPEIFQNTIDVETQLENKIEYLEIAYYLSDIIDDYFANLNSIRYTYPKAADFLYNGKSLNSIISDFSFIRSTIDNLKKTIASNRYGFGHLESYLIMTLNDAIAQKENYQTRYDAAKLALENYKSSVESIAKDDSGSTVYQFNNSYTILANNLYSYGEQLGAAKYREARLQEFKNNLKAGDDQTDDNTEQTLISASNSLKNTLDAYNEFSDFFNRNKVKISSAAVSNPAHSVTESFINMKLILITDLAVALIAYLFSFSKTYTVMKKKGEL